MVDFTPNPPDPVLESIRGDAFQVREAFPVKFGFWLRGFQFTIPEGFISDLASIPRVLRIFADRADLGILAVIVHDYLCSTEGRYINVQGEEVQLHWLDVHLFFLVAMRIDGITWYKSLVAFTAVMLFGPKW
jgi:hypothetical protein